MQKAGQLLICEKSTGYNKFIKDSLINAPQ